MFSSILFAAKSTFTSPHKGEGPPLNKSYSEKVSLQLRLLGHAPQRGMSILQIVAYYTHRKFYLIVTIILGE